MEESLLSLPGFQPRLLDIQETKEMVLRLKTLLLFSVWWMGTYIEFSTVPALEQIWGYLQGKDQFDWHNPCLFD